MHRDDSPLLRHLTPTVVVKPALLAVPWWAANKHHLY